ncbi:enoyl-CoA hydratase/isomerase family protein [Tumebacillus permanentifrigoris]|uniref:2-(1,2-epoxy-1,2-dihydrophenyl)acetyl-CoA isomerase n=1 Tax=Tumebacillus permanentifrigoris TaxID=378543 RepID=A0A316D662_9BACL|nr:enoyl-CoA hydratase/isomerase family protein [Tumebacillus permanentifrigoris]PWK07431.1 2-(1,2-epoxy-1,2-dihydrophenyl)acetyl-CoA isomerase [Tumebacillus permanentifrigoris]
MSLVNIRNAGAVRYVELDDQEKKNALDPLMADALLAAMEQVHADPECKIIVFTSTGRNYFSIGPDLEGMIELASREDGVQDLERVAAKLNAFIMAIHTSPKITIAALHGYAFGGGLNVFLACDYRIAEAKTKFIEKFYYMGITPDLSSSYFLPRLIGQTRTKDLLLTGRMFTAREAADWGLFQEVIDKRSEMMARVEALCNQFLTGGTDTIVGMKALLNRDDGLAEHLELEKTWLCERFRDPSVRERLMNIRS